MENVRQYKADIRKEVLARRNGIDKDTGAQFSYAIKKHFLTLDEDLNTRFDIGMEPVISAFLPIKTEVDLRPLIDALWGRRKTICLPVMLDHENMVFRRYDRDTVLVDNGFGTLAPDKNYSIMEPDIMLVPLVAYDEAGYRIGYGAGYYDRAIAQLQSKGKSPLLIGVAFSIQKVPQIPFEEHDIPLDMILTEEGVLTENGLHNAT